MTEKPYHLQPRVETFIDGQWRHYICLIEGSDRPGHYGAAAESWVWANDISKRQPELFRIVRPEIKENNQ